VSVGLMKYTLITGGVNRRLRFGVIFFRDTQQCLPEALSVRREIKKPPAREAFLLNQIHELTKKTNHGFDTRGVFNWFHFI
ncbi:MAG: hypothetical protein ACKOZM_05690, partial [Flavobacteriales bacterium]